MGIYNKLRIIGRFKTITNTLGIQIEILINTKSNFYDHLHMHKDQNYL